LQLYVAEVLLYVFVNDVDGVGGEKAPAAHSATGVSLDRPGRHRAGATAVADASAGDGSGLFTLAALGYAVQRPGHSLALLQAGCTTAGDDPDLLKLRACGCDVTVSLIDDDNTAARDAVTADPGLAGCTLADLRVVPLAPRSFDIVHCTLLERIANAELVLDRLVSTLRPGGLLLVRTGDRDSAAGFLDRVLPRPVRALVARSRRPGRPRLYPAVYEPVASGRGIQSYVQRRGLVISQREARSEAAEAAGPSAQVPLAWRLVSRLSMGRISCAHDELCYVIRKPEPGFARVL
jgi:SAM-dependent methyltransferase